MNFDRMRALLLEQAVQGKLVPQLEDEPAVEQIGEAPNVVPLLIPKTWKWVRLNNLTTIVRGGSPRPIQAFLTDREDGLNWVKIGDAERGSMHISQCAEKNHSCRSEENAIYQKRKPSSHEFNEFWLPVHSRC